jgi:hypothetical protein
MSIDPKDCSFGCGHKSYQFWRLCWNQTPLLKLLLKFSHTCELRISRIDTHSLFCNPRDKHREQRSRSGREFQLCVEKQRHIHKYRSIHLLLKVFDEAHSISELFKVSEDLGIIELGFAMLITWLVKCKWGRTQQGAIASNDVKEESHSFHILWSISVACAVGPSANVLPNWFLLSKPVFVTLLNFQWLKAL